MRVARLVLLWLAGVVLLTVAAVAIAAWRSIPPLGGRAAVEGLEAPVEVSFDSLGVPHLSARSDADLFRALGYLHARDRLWQMEVMRHAAEGRLAEVLGPGAGAVASDRFLRSLDIPRVAAAAMQRMDPESRPLLEAYAGGVNAWIARPARGLPLELRILRHQPERWTPLSSAEVSRLLSWDLVTSGDELALARVAARLGMERARELFPVDPEGAVTLPPGSGRWSGRSGTPTGGRSRERTRADALPSAQLALREIPEIPELARSILAGASLRRASNAWVIGPARTRSGKPILANDPHLDLRAPSLWYLAALESPGFQVAGGTIPGLPAVPIGRNRRIAWGMTTMQVDDLDYVIERLSADSSRVLTREGWQEVEVVRDSIRVRGGAAVPFTLRRTSHGPLIGGDTDLTGAADSGEVRALALRWVAHEPSDELTAVLGVNRAAGWEDFLQAVAHFKSPEQNWVYADADGNIGYTASGNVPVRRSGRGSLPTPGWTDEGRWERYLEFDELPHAFNPPEGFIVTANNRIVGGEYPHPLVAKYALPYRAERIREMILAGSALTIEDVRRMQMDTLDVFARRTRELAARAAESEGRADLAQRLRDWDGTIGSDRSEPSLFYVWYRQLQKLTFEDELGYAPTGRLDAWLRSGESRWFDDARTPETEDLEAMSRRAMRTAFGFADTPWGQIHRTVSQHALGSVAALRRLLRLNIRPRPRAGSLYTVNVAEFTERTPPFYSTHAASLRMVVDLAVDEAALVLTTGQSGHPLSRRYRNQVDRWWNGQLWNVPLDRERVAAVATLRLEPPR